MPKKCGFAKKYMILTPSIIILFLPLLPSPKAADEKLVPVFSIYQQSGLHVSSNCITNIVTPPSLLFLVLSSSLRLPWIGVAELNFSPTRESDFCFC